MLISYKNIHLNYEILNSNPLAPYIFLLHGFTGSSNDWIEPSKYFLRNYNIIAFDVIGHGKSSSPDDVNLYTQEEIVEQLKAIIQFFTQDKVILLGYSMGGRIALSFAVRYPDMLQGLILESTSAGLLNEDERKSRYESDLKLTEYINSHSMNEFINYWVNIPLFTSQKKLNLSESKSEKKNNNKIGLINSLKGFSTGRMNPLHKHLHKISFPTLLITGELDTKFTTLNKDLNKNIITSTHIIIDDAGHNTHLERPQEFAQTINNFLIKHFPAWYLYVK